MNYAQGQALIDTQTTDPVGLAREIGGGNRDAELVVGLALIHRQKDLTRAICSENDDIYYSMGIDECLRILGEEGFAIIPVGSTKGGGRFWLLWHEDLKLLGQLTSIDRANETEKLNSLNFNGQFIGDEAMTFMRKHNYGGSGTISVRLDDLQDVHVRSWNIRDGLRHFMRCFETSGAIPVEAWLAQNLYLPGEDMSALDLLPESARQSVSAGVEVIPVHELHKYGK